LPPFVFFSEPGTSWHFKSFTCGRKKEEENKITDSRQALQLCH